MNEKSSENDSTMAGIPGKGGVKAKADLQATRTPSSMAGGYSEAAARFEWIIEELNPRSVPGIRHHTYFSFDYY
jgi:hypothetical protein